MLTDRKSFLRIWLTITLIGATAHLTLWCAAYLAVVSTWTPGVAPPGYGLNNLATHGDVLALTWLWHAAAAGIAGVVAAAAAPRLSRLSWLMLSTVAGACSSALLTAVFTSSRGGFAQAALLGAISVFAAALVVLTIDGRHGATPATA